jgi:hypothetical protein
MRFVTVLFLVSSFLFPLALSAQTEEKDVTVPVSSLVMFTSGVSYFQHDGTVDGNAKMELTFSTGQINDLLKSLVLRDLDGGTISSVTYSSRDPITRTLKSFVVDLTSNPSLSNLLSQTRGEPIEVTVMGGNKVSGTVISVETRPVISGGRGADQVAVPGDFLNLNTQAGVTSLALADVQGIRYTRKEVQDDLAQALQVLSSSHGIEKKKVVLHFSGKGKRRVRIGYILESPVWKTSYRLVLGDSGQHLLQGWALVENTSDTDWRSVALTLVSGRPITFIMDLYQPLYIQRPEVQLELYQSLIPKTNQMALDEEEPALQAEMASATPSAAPSPPSMAKAAAPRLAARGAASGAEAFSVSQGVTAAASGGQVGDLFQYAIDKPVSLSRQQSAMLPILNQQVSGERYSLYNVTTDPKFPLNAVKLKNASSLHLMQGPITVFDAGSYAGDAQISDLAPGAEQLITYAMDLDTEVAPQQGASPVTLISVKISRGVFFFTNKLQQERIYTIKNRGTKNRTVLVEHPLSPDWTLVNPKEATERTRDSYRFAVPVASGKTVALSVVEIRTQDQSVSLASLGSDQVAFYVRSQVVSAAVKAALQKLVGLQQKIADTMAQRSRMESRMNEISNDQSRIRQNMDRLSQTSDLYRRYVKTLSDEEDELGRLRDSVAKLRDQEAAQRKDIDTFIQSLEVS